MKSSPEPPRAQPATTPDEFGHPLADHPGAPLLFEDGPIWTLRFNRPQEHNRLDPLDVDALLALFASGFAVGSPTALVITGNDARSFSSGYTLDAIVGQLDDRFERMLDQLERLPCLTIAAINGSVYGGATDLALCCDIRIGQTGTKMFMPAARIGLHYYPGGLRRYVTRMGLSAASKLMLTGLTIDAPEMLRIGFLTDLVSPEELPATLATYIDANRLTEPKVVAKMKGHLGAIANTAANQDWEVLNAQIQRDYADSVASTELARRLSELRRK
jgi:methylglutaconyl-CoA hydratase